MLNDVAERNSIFNKPEPFSGRTPSFQNQKEYELTDKSGGKTDEMNYIARQEEENPFNRYRVNLFVNNEKQKGAPVVVEANPYYYNIFGKIEYKSQLLVMNTDFTLVKHSFKTLNVNSLVFFYF